MKLRFALRSMTLLLAVCSSALASTVWYVDGVNGNDNNNCKSRQRACKTIGHAISLASSGDSVRVAAAIYTENLRIGISLKVIGSGAATTIIDGGGAGSVVWVSASGVVLAKFTIRNGKGFGGGVFNLGTLTINDSIITRNSSNGVFLVCSAGGVLSRRAVSINHTTISDNQGLKGAGLCVTGGAAINNSTISGNSAFTTDEFSCPQGGGIWGSRTINNSTISGNIASKDSVSGCLADGGGIYGRPTIKNSTISGNAVRGHAGTGGGIIGGTLQNSIVANNYGGNCSGTVISNGYNLSSDGTCDFNGTGDLNNTDPKLGQLGNYGGPTQTIPLLSGSPAIDAGNATGCTDGQGHLLKTDQRGRPRHDKEDKRGCDMGAYERQKD
jgi:hypothetical protein